MSRKSIKANAKDAERAVASALDGKRLVAGQWRGAGDVDVEGTNWYAQVKHRQPPTWFTEGRKQIEEACKSTDKTPLLVIKTKPGSGQPSRIYVVVDIEDWIRLQDNV